MVRSLSGCPVCCLLSQLKLTKVPNKKKNKASTIRIHFPLQPPGAFSQRAFFLREHPARIRCSPQATIGLDITRKRSLASFHIRGRFRPQEPLLHQEPTSIRPRLRPIQSDCTVIDPQHPRPRRSPPGRLRPQRPALVSRGKHQRPPQTPEHLYRNKVSSRGAGTDLQNQSWLVGSVGPSLREGSRSSSSSSSSSARQS